MPVAKMMNGVILIWRLYQKILLETDLKIEIESVKSHYKWTVTFPQCLTVRKILMTAITSLRKLWKQV